MKQPDLYQWNSWGMSQDDNGDWVTYSAWHNANSEVERLQRKVKELEQQIGRSYDAHIANKERPHV